MTERWEVTREMDTLVPRNLWKRLREGWEPFGVVMVKGYDEPHVYLRRKKPLTTAPIAGPGESR